MIKHLSIPERLIGQRRYVSTILKTREGAEPYGRWVWQTVLENTSPGEKVLVVVHKALLDHRHGLPDNANDPKGVEKDGRTVHFVNWGAGIGSNRWKLCKAVFLFGEFHIPRRATVGYSLGLKEKTASRDNLAPFQSTASKHRDFVLLRDGHLLRHEKQMATRGNARNISGDGVCGEQRLYVTAEFSRFIQHVDTLFPGACLEQTEESRAKARETGGVASLVSLLRTIEESEITFATVKDRCKVDLRKHGKRYFAHPAVQATLQDRGWTYVPGMGRGNPSRLVRVLH